MPSPPPLEGVRVLEVGNFMAGPFCGMQLADLGADVIKVENPAGGEEPVKVGVPICDLVCALYGALAAVAALQARERDGRGQHIDVSLFEAGVSLAVWEAGRYFATGEVGRPLGSAHQTTAPYQAFRASDGFFTAGAGSPANWLALCQVLGLEHRPAGPTGCWSTGRA